MSTMNREQRRAAAKQAKKEAKANAKKYEEALSGLTWDELEESYQLGKDLLAAQEDMIAVVDKNAEYVKDKEYLEEVKAGIRRDIASLSEELETIHQSHAGKSGPAVEDDIMECVDTSVTYVNFTQRAAQLLQPQESALEQLFMLACQEAVKQEGEAANPGPLNLGEVSEKVLAQE